MPLTRPTLSQLINQAGGDIEASLPTGTLLLRFANLPIIGKVLAGLVNGLYGYLDWIARQCTPFTATGEFLEAWAALKNVIRKPPTAAIGAVTFPATGTTILAAGSPIVRNDGAAYVTTADATASGGSIIVPLAAVDPGATGNAVTGTAMTLAVGVSGISSSGQVTSTLAGGADLEVDDALRSRMLATYAAPPQGGARTDYIEWALAVPGVTRCWPYPSAMGPGTIVLLFMMDDAEAAHGGFPQGSDGCATGETRDTAATGDQLILADAIFEKQPVTALVYAVSPTANTIGLTLAGIAGASTSTKAAIASAFAAALRTNANPGGVTNISAIEGAIASIAGTAGFVLTLVTASAGTVSPGSAGNITSSAGALPTPGAITYV
jgi:uncharacterized phage protein gp47/JayE